MFLILGTSTGSLIAFGLVGGNENENGARIPMSVQEITDLYKEEIPKLFPKRKPFGRWAKSWFTGWRKSADEWAGRRDSNGWFYNVFGLKSRIGIPTTPYPRKSFEEALKKRFQNTRTTCFVLIVSSTI